MADTMALYKEWYDAQWLGDQEHGQYLPHNGDPKYTEYLDGYTVGLGAWIAAIEAAARRLEEEAKYGCPCNEDERLTWENADLLREWAGLPKRLL